MRFTLQKAVELGAHEICPVITHRSGPKLDAHRIEKKMRHWQQIVISSCEQSGRTHLPKLCPPLTLSRYFSTHNRHFGIVLDPAADKNLSDLPHDMEKITILVGAEGGLTEEEIKLAVNNGFHTIRLGPRILRTETAGISVLAAVQTLWGDFS